MSTSRPATIARRPHSRCRRRRHVLSRRAATSCESRCAACSTTPRSRRRGPRAPKALIAPHAGYVYSGPIAASAFRRVAPLRDRVRRVVLLGPSHFVPSAGSRPAAPRAFATPLGAIEIDARGRGRCSSAAVVRRAAARARSREHCLEVELPFLQQALGPFRIVPLVVGEASDRGGRRARSSCCGAATRR